MSISDLLRARGFDNGVSHDAFVAEQDESKNKSIPGLFLDIGVFLEKKLTSRRSRSRALFHLVNLAEAQLKSYGVFTKDDYKAEAANKFLRSLPHLVVCGLVRRLARGNKKIRADRPGR